MPLYALDGAEPRVHPDAFVAPTASLVGRVVVEAGASVWYGAVLRADFDEVVIGAGANVQDNAVVHCGVPGVPARIGERATIGHLCVVHGCDIGARSLIGNGATILDGARVGEGALVAAGAVVLSGAEIPPGTIAAGVPAAVRGPLRGDALAWVTENPNRYRELARRHAGGLRIVEVG